MPGLCRMNDRVGMASAGVAEAEGCVRGHAGSIRPGCISALFKACMHMDWRARLCAGVWQGVAGGWGGGGCGDRQTAVHRPDQSALGRSSVGRALQRGRLLRVKVLTEAAALSTV